MIIKHKLTHGVLVTLQHFGTNTATNTAKVQMLKNITAASCDGCVQKHCQSITRALRPAVHIASICALSLLDFKPDYQQAQALTKRRG